MLLLTLLCQGKRERLRRISLGIIPRTDAEVKSPLLNQHAHEFGVTLLVRKENPIRLLLLATLVLALMTRARRQRLVTWEHQVEGRAEGRPAVFGTGGAWRVVWVFDEVLVDHVAQLWGEVHEGERGLSGGEGHFESLVAGCEEDEGVR